MGAKLCEKGRLSGLNQALSHFCLLCFYKMYKNLECSTSNIRAPPYKLALASLGKLRKPRTG